jgi:hypothetical protein
MLLLSLESNTSRTLAQSKLSRTSCPVMKPFMDALLKDYRNEKRTTREVSSQVIDMLTNTVDGIAQLSKCFRLEEMEITAKDRADYITRVVAVSIPVGSIKVRTAGEGSRLVDIPEHARFILRQGANGSIVVRGKYEVLY